MARVVGRTSNRRQQDPCFFSSFHSFSLGGSSSKRTPQSKNNFHSKQSESEIQTQFSNSLISTSTSASRAMANDDCCATQLIDGDGEFNVAGLDNFIRTVNLASCGLSYAVVAIMGPQSSGAFIPPSIFHSCRFRLLDLLPSNLCCDSFVFVELGSIN